MNETLLNIMFILIGIYTFIWLLYLAPKAAKIKWINKLFSLGEAPPRFDFTCSGWGFLYSIGWFLGILLIITIFVFLGL